jgi:hypothetical protein
MAYIQKNNPIAKTACGRRRMSKDNPLPSKILKSVSKELKKASNTHAGQAEKIDKFLEDSPAKGKISASCKAQAKKKFKVWPSAYASGWGVRCTRGDFKKKS